MISNWQKKLRQVFSEMQGGSRPVALSAPILREIVNAPSSEELARYAFELSTEGSIKVRYRVISPDTKNTVAEYGYFYDIPARIYDENSDAYFNVQPSRDVEIVYTAQRG